jgi:hypothetical protein
MPNGKPGDHPFTDIIYYRRPVYSPDIDDLVRELAKLSDTRGQQELADMLFREYNEFAKPDLTKLQQILASMRDQRRADAERRGWEL